MRAKATKTLVFRGILDDALGNFTCLRGYARMEDLHKISVADPSYQRNQIDTHLDKMVAFLSDEKHLFFPEVILGASLGGENNPQEVERFYKEFNSGSSEKYRFMDFRLDYYIATHKKPEDTRTKLFSRRANLFVNSGLQNEQKFHRIDGNHRLSVLDKEEKIGSEITAKFKNLNVPFCLVLFLTDDDLKRHSRALFHNLNFNQIPITKEKNLELILDDKGTLFIDDDLKGQFGEHYLQAREILNSWKLNMISHIKGVIEPAGDKQNTVKRTYLVNLLELLAKHNIDYEQQRFLDCLSEINLLYKNPKLQTPTNHGLLTVFSYYALKNPNALKIFYNWVIQNHIYKTKDINAEELIKVFDAVIESNHRTIFVSMQFSEETKENYDEINNAVKDVNDEYKLDLQIKQIRIDKFQKGYSYKITDEILSLIEGCGYLIADLSLGNKNVYHEIGYLMGLNQGKGLPQNNFLLVFNEKLTKADFDKDVGFNLKANQVQIAKGTGKLRTKVKEQIEIYYKLKPTKHN